MDLNNAPHPKVSVIVPVYRSEAYLERCCRSLFSQTLNDLECLFVLDGPSMVSEKIISETVVDYPRRQDQVRIIRHEKNLGTSYSRQEAHELATGEYLYHCDSDDWLEPEALQIVYDKAQEEMADLVFFDYIRHYEDSAAEVLYSSAQVQKGVINTIDGTLCNKLIRHKLVSDNTLSFPEGINWGEDLCMSVMLQVLAKKIVYIPQVFYHYYLHQNSFTTAVNREKYMQLIACPAYVEQQLLDHHLAEKYASLIMQMKFEVKEYFLIHPHLRDISQWLAIYPESHRYIWDFSSVPIYLKCVSWLAAHHMTFVANTLLICREYYHRLRS